MLTMISFGAAVTNLAEGYFDIAVCARDRSFTTKAAVGMGHVIAYTLMSIFGAHRQGACLRKLLARSARAWFTAPEACRVIRADEVPDITSYRLHSGDSANVMRTRVANAHDLTKAFVKLA